MGLGASVRKVSMSAFYCQKCGDKIILPRKKNLRRERGHVKHIYCIKCKEVTPHNEVRECDFTLPQEV